MLLELKELKVLSYWNLNILGTNLCINEAPHLKVLSYWNLNLGLCPITNANFFLKVLSYWNLNFASSSVLVLFTFLKYYHIGI